jgi:gluconokinase
MIVVVMGVSGCGKSTIAEALARRAGGEFLDADAYHPAANVEKMSRGIPLTDEDRAGWLSTLAGLLAERRTRRQPTILACSALKEAYRQRLRVGPEVRFVYLKGTYEVLLERMQQRQGHFMKAEMLKSQFAALEEPATGEGTDALAVDVSWPVERIVDAVVAWPGLGDRS